MWRRKAVEEDMTDGERALKKAREEQRDVKYMEDGGCEITVTPDGQFIPDFASWK